MTNEEKKMLLEKVFCDGYNLTVHIIEDLLRNPICFVDMTYKERNRTVRNSFWYGKNDEPCCDYKVCMTYNYIDDAYDGSVADAMIGILERMEDEKEKYLKLKEAEKNKSAEENVQMNAKKWCPLMVMKRVMSESGYIVSDETCESNCAWYDKERNQCCFLTIAQNNGGKQ